MTNENLIFMRFYRIANMVRDCLMFLLNEGALDEEICEMRGQFFKTVIEDKVIVNFFEKNGENGVKFLKNLESFHQDLYGTKRMINLRDGKQYTDSSSKLKLLDYIIGNYQGASNLLRDIAADLEKRNLLDLKIPVLLKAEDEYYRALAMLSIYRSILSHNKELMQNLKESNGKKTPNVTFVFEELKKMVGMLRFVVENYKGDNPLVNTTFENLMTTLKFLDGTIKSDDPQDIAKSVDESEKACIAFIHVSEKAWVEIFRVIVEEIQPKQEEKEVFKA